MATSIVPPSSLSPMGISPVPASSFKREFRLRSLSGSIDVDYASDTFPSRKSSLISYEGSLGVGLSALIGGPGPAYRESRSLPVNRRAKANSTDLSECPRRVSSPPQLAPSVNDLYALRQEDLNRVLELQSLPTVCKQRVFHFLSPLERGVAARTCREWSELMRHPSLWSVVDLTIFPSCTSCSAGSSPAYSRSPSGEIRFLGNGKSAVGELHSILSSGEYTVSSSSSSLYRECSIQCYYDYRNRVTKFLRYLISVKPSIRVFRFSLDIGDPEDGWMDLVLDLIKVSRCKEMTHADISWHETPAKRAFLPDTSITWSNSDYKELTFRRRHRQRLFVRLFDVFTAATPNLEVLRLPFDWSERSRQVIGRLRNLRVLELRKYFQYGRVEPEHLKELVQAAPCLEKLVLELWSETYGGFSYFSLASTTLQCLDVSSCRGVYFIDLSLPNLRQFRVTRRPMSFHMGTGEQGGPEPTPCMYEILCRGAPGLTQLNDLRLAPDWAQAPCGTLDLECVLSSVCSCRQHMTPSDNDMNIDNDNVMV